MKQDQRTIDVVPTSSQLAEAVTAQHAMIRAAFQAARQGTDQTRQEALRRLLSLLALHEAAEQLTVHPALERISGSEVAIAADRMAEERQAVQLVERLQECTHGSYEYAMQLVLLQEAITHHATAEELSEVPMFDDLLESERVAIGRALRAVTTAVDDECCPVDYGPFSAMVQEAAAWLG